MDIFVGESFVIGHFGYTLLNFGYLDLFNFGYLV